MAVLEWPFWTVVGTTVVGTTICGISSKIAFRYVVLLQNTSLNEGALNYVILIFSQYYYRPLL